MKLTDAHVSEQMLSVLIGFYSKPENFNEHEICKALLELKQRRAIDRAKAEKNA